MLVALGKRDLRLLAEACRVSFASPLFFLSFLCRSMAELATMLCCIHVWSGTQVFKKHIFLKQKLLLCCLPNRLTASLYAPF